MNNMIFLSTKIEAMIFKSLGFDVFIIHDENDLTTFFNKLNDEIKVIGYDSDLSELILKFKNEKNSFPMFLELPLDESHIGKKTMEIKEKIKKSIGIDLL